jgi:hypothetical protein
VAKSRASSIALGAAYGILEEGIALAMFNPASSSKVIPAIERKPM